MPTLDISEYCDSSHGNLIEPPAAHQALPLGSDPVESKPFNRLTRCVRIVADANCRIGFGDKPMLAPLAAGQAETRVVQPGDKLSAVADDSAPTGAADQVAALIALIAYPKEAAKRKAELEKLEAGAKASLAQIRDEAAELATARAAHDQAATTLAAETAEFKAFFAEHDADLKRRETTLSNATVEFKGDIVATEKSLAGREAALAGAAAEFETRAVATEKSLAGREAEIAQRQRALKDSEASVAELRADLERRLGLIKQAQG